jgi:hypothetical protein
MFPAIDGSEDDGIFMEVMTIQLTAVSQFKDSLPNLKGSTINLIKEKADRLFTSHLEPIGRIEASAIAFDAGETDKVTFRHLAGTALNDRQAGRGGQLIDNLALANTVATTEENWQPSRANCWGESDECFEVN